ncbi:hypothetical protein VTK56DRAFT_4222 [Thermocarpiscus australiensis]
MAALLFRLGFESDQILDSIHQSADSVIAHNALLEARPPDHFAYDAFAQRKIQMMNLFMTARELPTENVISAAELDNFVGTPTRYGKPSEAERKQAKPLLFANRLHRPQEEFDTMTPFLIRKSVYLTFFGMPEFDHVKVVSGRREKLGSIQSGQTSTYSAEDEQLRDKKRRLEEEWQELETAKRSQSQELERERTRLVQDLNENTKAFEERCSMKYKELLKEEKAKMMEAFEGYKKEHKAVLESLYNRRFDEWSQEEKRISERQLELEEGNETLKDVVKQNTIQIEEQKDLIRKTRQHLEEEKAKFEEQVGQAQQLLNENKRLSEQVQQLRLENERRQRDAERQLLEKEEGIKAEIEKLQEQRQALEKQLQGERQRNEVEFKQQLASRDEAERRRQEEKEEFQRTKQDYN